MCRDAAASDVDYNVFVALEVGSDERAIRAVEAALADRARPYLYVSAEAAVAEFVAMGLAEDLSPQERLDLELPASFRVAVPFADIDVLVRDLGSLPAVWSVSTTELPTIAEVCGDPRLLLAVFRASCREQLIRWGGGFDVIVFMDPAAEAAAIDAVGERLTADGLEFEYFTQAEAFEEFTEIMPEEVVALLDDPSGLPSSFRVVLGHETPTEVANRYENIAGVRRVLVQSPLAGVCLQLANR